LYSLDFKRERPQRVRYEIRPRPGIGRLPVFLAFEIFKDAFMDGVGLNLDLSFDAGHGGVPGIVTDTRHYWIEESLPCAPSTGEFSGTI